MGPDIDGAIARMIDRWGCRIVLRRIVNGLIVDRDARATLRPLPPEQLAGDLDQSGCRAIVLAADLAGSPSLPPVFMPPVKGDRAVARGAVQAVVAVDATTYAVGGRVIAYVLTLRGT